MSKTPIADSLRDHGSKYYNHPRYDDKLVKAIEKLEMENEELRRGHERYETARRMNPRQWADAWALNISTGKTFDEIIDNLKPFRK